MTSVLGYLVGADAQDSVVGTESTIREWASLDAQVRTCSDCKLGSDFNLRSEHAVRFIWRLFTFKRPGFRWLFSRFGGGCSLIRCWTLARLKSMLEALMPGSFFFFWTSECGDCDPFLTIPQSQARMSLCSDVSILQHSELGAASPCSLLSVQLRILVFWSFMFENRTQMFDSKLMHGVRIQ